MGPGEHGAGGKAAVELLQRYQDATIVCDAPPVKIDTGSADRYCCR